MCAKSDFAHTSHTDFAHIGLCAPIHHLFIQRETQNIEKELTQKEEELTVAFTFKNHTHI
jgi:hypothetical protein